VSSDLVSGSSAAKYVRVLVVWVVVLGSLYLFQEAFR
jgi:hypothetical protein